MANDVKAAASAINNAQKEIGLSGIAEAASRLGSGGTKKSNENTTSAIPSSTVAAAPVQTETQSVSAEPMLNQLNTAQQEAQPKVGRPARARTPVSESKGIMMAN